MDAVENFDPIAQFVFEIKRRSSRFFESCNLFIPERALLLDAVGEQVHRVSTKHLPAEAGVDKAFDQLKAHSVQVQVSDDTDSVTQMFFKALADSILIHSGELRVPSCDRACLTEEESLGHFNSIPLGDDGRCLRVSRSEGESLIIINAMGIPWTSWVPLLGDGTLPIKLIFWQTPGGKFFGRGMGQALDIEVLVRDFEANVKPKIAGKFHILGWCNGGRLAIALAARYPELVRSLILLSPTFKNMKNNPVPSSAFEEDMHKLYKIGRSNAAMASMVVNQLNNTSMQVDVGRWNHEPGKRRLIADQLLGQPDKELVDSLKSPWSDVASFGFYAESNQVQEAFDLESAVKNVKAPIYWLSGSHDRIVSNEQVRQGLRLNSSGFQHFELFGAGHFWHCQQYPYFRYVLERILNRNNGTVCSARVVSEAQL
jgi:pimeloyl-ACP methyl ester carboxylesterase